MASLKLTTLVAIFCCILSIACGSIILSVGMDDSDNTDLLENFSCPGVGNFAVRQSGNCAKYFECRQSNKKPHAIKQCFEPEHHEFNRLSRTCEKSEIVKCKWCRKQGLHADRTSNRHFIQCVPGVVGIRYKCKNGRWNAEERRCDKIAGQQFEIAVDAEEDPPESINNFMLEWKAIEQAEEDLYKKKMRKLQEQESAENRGKSRRKRWASKSANPGDQTGRGLGEFGWGEGGYQQKKKTNPDDFKNKRLAPKKPVKSIEDTDSSEEISNKKKSSTKDTEAEN